MDSAQAKKELRRELKNRWKTCPSETYDAASLAIQTQLASFSLARGYSRIAIYSALASEPDLAGFAVDSFTLGRPLFFPKVDPETNNLDFFAVSKLADLHSGAYGILEPTESATTKIDPSEIDLICVPGLGFDRQGHRLGRGKGYYDRYLARLPIRTFKLGIFFSLQEVSQLPVCDYDVSLNGILTEQELFLPSGCAKV